MLGGIPFYVDQTLCQVKFVRWRRNHRKSRINKKWHKKYGFIAECGGYGFHMDGMGMYVCPCMANQIRAKAEK